MRKLVQIKNTFSFLVALLFLVQCGSNSKNADNLKIIYPLSNTLFPADITAPNFIWQDDNSNVKSWQITVFVSEKEVVSATSEQLNWRPTETEWQQIKETAMGKQLVVSIEGKNRKTVSSSTLTIEISDDKVEVPIFYRAVPLPFKFARENLKRVRWHMGSVSETSKPHVVLDNIPVCANCHSFTPDGKTIAMDVDARDDKGAYAISALKENTLLSSDSIIHWSEHQDGEFTYGLLSQISPNGRYVVSTLRDCEIFADRNDLEFSQLFFPFKGILVVYDRQEKRYFELEGANDTTLVQSNPIWSPDGEFIYFTCAKAKHFEESGIEHGSVAKPETANVYKVFENHFMKRDSLIKYDICKVPFNNGKGGKVIPVPGASRNGLSNYFPKISSDGKWLVFCQAESFMLLQKDSKLFITSTDGGDARQMTCNTDNMNSWHSWSPNSKWLVFATKGFGPYTQLCLTHINDDGSDSPPVYLENFSFDKYANNIPEFVNIKYDKKIKIEPTFLSENDFIVRNGEIKQKAGDSDGAFKDFDKAVKMFPKEADPYYQRGRIYFEKKEFVKAINDFDKAIGIEKAPTYYTSRGITYLNLNQNKKAIEDLSRASRLDPTRFSPWTYLGVAYANAENYTEAIYSLEKAVGLCDGDAYTFYYLGLVHFSTRAWKKSIESLTKAIELIPDNSIKNIVYETRARALLNSADYASALKDANVAIGLSPNDPAPLILKGKAELYMGLRTEALQSFNRAKNFGSSEAAALIRENS